MKVFAPGKLILSGAYVVLEGAPSLVVAVDRGAIASSDLWGPPRSAELSAAFSTAHAPSIDVSAMLRDGRKLGLGASAASLVAALALVEAQAGADLEDDATRLRVFLAARRAHAVAQGGGSGVDIAASVYGGLLRYELGGDGRGYVQRLALPPALTLRAYFTGESASTPALRGAVDALRGREPALHARCFASLVRIAERASDAAVRGDGHALVAAVADSCDALAALGDAARAEIVPVALRALGEEAKAEGGAFTMSGAGGGDVAVYLGPRAPSRSFEEQLARKGLVNVPVVVDHYGARVLDEGS